MGWICGMDLWLIFFGLQGLQLGNTFYEISSKCNESGDIPKMCPDSAP